MYVQKEIVGNADLHKPVLNKTMTTQEQCVKYDLVAPLNLNHIKYLLTLFHRKSIILQDKLIILVFFNTGTIYE